MAVSRVSDEEAYLLQATPVARTSHLASSFGEPHLGNQLIHQDDDPNRADESPQERSTQDVIQEAEPGETGDEDDASGHPRDDSGHPGVIDLVVVTKLARVNIGPYDGAEQQGASGFGAHHHARTAAQERVHQRAEDECVQAVDGRDVPEVGGEGQRHGQIEGRHGQGRGEIPSEPRPAVLPDPGEERDVVGQIPAPMPATSQPSIRAVACRSCGGPGLTRTSTSTSCS